MDFIRRRFLLFLDLNARELVIAVAQFKTPQQQLLRHTSELQKSFPGRIAAVLCLPQGCLPFPLALR